MLIWNSQGPGWLEVPSSLACPQHFVGPTGPRCSNFPPLSVRCNASVSLGHYLLYSSHRNVIASCYWILFSEGIPLWHLQAWTFKSPAWAAQQCSGYSQPGRPPRELAAARSAQAENTSRAEKAKVGCETSMPPAPFLRRFCCYGNPLPQAHFIKASPRMVDWIQLLHKVAIIHNNWGTYGLDLSHSAFLMKLAGQFFQDPWHSVLRSTEGCIL